MAGGFNGDDEDFSQYDNDEEVDNEEELEDEETEDNDNNEDDEEGDEDSSEEDPSEQDKNNKDKSLEDRLQAEEDALKGKKVDGIKLFPTISKQGNEAIREAKKHPTLWRKAFDVVKAWGTKVVEFIRNNISAIVMILGIFLAIFIAIPAVLAVLVWPIKWLLWPDDDTDYGDGSSGGMETSFGVNGEDFYGVRTIYSDDEKARAGLLEEYSTLVEEVRENAINYTYTISREVGEGETKTYTVTVTVNLEQPKQETEGEGEPEDYDYSKFEESSFKTDYINYYNLLNEIAGVVAQKDIETGSVEDGLIAKLNSIKYFGFDDTLINITESNSTDDVDDVVLKFFLDKYSNVIIDSDGNVDTSIALTTDETNSIKAGLTSVINETFNSLELNRSEKVFIKDYVFEKAEDMMKGVAEENYITWIFMPKNAVQFKKFSFFVSHSDFDNFKISVFNETTEIALKKDDYNYADLGGNTAEAEGEKKAQLFVYVKDKLSEDAQAFEAIDTSNLNALAEGVSLGEIVNSANINTEIYLEKDANGIYTYKKSGVRVAFESNVKFSCAELETLWN